MRFVAFPSLVLACLVALAPAPSAGQVCTDTNGTFRFLNTEFPDLSTNGPVFTGQLVVANADGPVTFSLDLTGGNDPLPDGLTLDPDSGLITGLATQSGNYDVEFVADDGVTDISQSVSFSVSSSGGGGNGGSGLTAPVFPDGTVGAAYNYLLDPDGTGPFTFGGSDLPPGLTLNGATGQVSGTPTAPGTYFMTLTVYDFDPSDENVGASVVPIRIFPAGGSTFAFVTQFLNNGEVGTPFCDQYLVENPALGGVVTFGATGLPAGLTLDPATGAVIGTPTADGTFLVTITANDGTDTITTNLSMVIAPSSSSSFHWNYLGVPAALKDVEYDRVPPIVLTAEGAAGAVTYAATGLPAGMSYDAASGEISGTPAQTGEYPVTFTASDAGSGAVITLDLVFVVLPTTGGDVSQIVVNFWVSRASLRLGEDGSESWRVSAIYNADRRTGNRFDPATDAFEAALGTRLLQVAAGGMTGDDQSASFSDAGPPSESVSVSADRQALSWSTGSDTFSETVPGVLSQRVTLGDSRWRLLLRFDDRGGFRPTGGFERPAFVLSQGSLSVEGPGLDSAKLTLLLGDPNFSYEGGVSALRLRILEGATELMDREFTALGGPAKLGTDKVTGKTTYAFRTLSDTELTDRISLGYSSGKGAMKVGLSAMDLSGISAGEAHLTFEVTIGERVYSTNVTFFESSPGRYGLAIP
jgi:hypothetical protein